MAGHQAVRKTLPGAPLPTEEAMRLVALKRYEILDTDPERIFDHITRLAAQMFGTPIALVSLIDETRQWFKSHHGIETSSTRRDMAFCGYALLQTDPLVVLDATRDDRFKGNPLVTGGPGIRFYAGAPLATPDGYTLGTLCVIDTAPRKEFTQEQCCLLTDIANLAMTEIEARSATLALNREIEQRRRKEEELRVLLREKECLMRELHHRVGNNLQVIDTLLYLETRQPQFTAENLDDLRERIHVLGVIHRLLMDSQNITQIGLKGFLDGLAAPLAQVQMREDIDLSCAVEIEPDPLYIDIDLAIPLGLLINELIAGARDRLASRISQTHEGRGRIDVVMGVDADRTARLLVIDNAPAAPAGTAPEAEGTPGIAGIGTGSVAAQIQTHLLGHLEADLTVRRSENTEIEVVFRCGRAL